MKKFLLVVLGAVLLLTLSSAVALAGPSSQPNYGTVDPTHIGTLPPEWLADVDKIIPAPGAPGGQIHIVTDPLVNADGVWFGSDTDASGWVTFWCQSTIGFRYNIGWTRLDRLSRYTVSASGIDGLIVPPGTAGAIDSGEGFWFVIAGFPNLDLGTVKTDAKGSGGVKGTAQLSSGHVYILWTVVTDSGGNVVLVTPLNDPNAFVVY